MQLQIVDFGVERWVEVISIGKTLHLDQAGCRSNLYRLCLSNHMEDS